MLLPLSIAHACTRLSLSLATVLFQTSARFLKDETNFYDIFAALVFGFSTINVLNLATRRFENPGRGLNYGEMLAIAVVIVSILFLTWEMLHVFHVLPLKLDF